MGFDARWALERWHRHQGCSRRCDRDRGPLGGRGRQGRGRRLFLSSRIIIPRQRGRRRRRRTMSAKSTMKRKKKPLRLATRSKPKALRGRACFAMGARRWCFGLVEDSSAGPRQNGQICYGKSGLRWRWDGRRRPGLLDLGVGVDGQGRWGRLEHSNKRAVSQQHCGCPGDLTGQAVRCWRLVMPKSVPLQQQYVVGEGGRVDGLHTERQSSVDGLDRWSRR